MAAVGLFAACDPCVDDISAPGSNITEQEFVNGFSVKQYSDETYTTEAADGNYFVFDTNPKRMVRIYTKDAEGNENNLAFGASNGTFKIVPKRGNPSEQTYYVETKNFDGSTFTFSKDCNVFVPSELTPEMRLLASDAFGYKVWMWDTEFRADGGAWGNIGYAAGADWTGGIWWACAPEDLAGQLQHSDTGQETGEESSAAYMEFYEDGNIITYSGAGNKIRSGKFTVDGFTGSKSHASIDGSIAEWSYGTLNTTAGSILWPFQINGGGTKPTSFEIVKLDASHLQLIYAAPGTGGWGEATWWAFKSASDPEGALTDFGTKSWTWDVDWRADGGAWGNLGYAPGDGASFVNTGNGIWWACAPADLTGQLNHSDTGVATGEEDPGAYMTFDWKNAKIDTYNAAGERVRGGSFEITNWGMGKRTQASVDGSQTEWALGTLNTDAGAILWPFQINGGGTKPTSFEIMQADDEHLKLIYAAPGTGGWGEATWWAFKKK